MVVCNLCKEEFKDNSGGQLTNHLLDVHKVSKSDYYVLTKLNGVDPKCACGYCDDRPSFYRNAFKKYASGHDNPKFKEDQYIKKFGYPKCKTCGDPVKFFRGIPNTYCKISCRPSCWNQDTIKKTVNDKYGVDNVMGVEKFRKRLSISNKKSWKKNHIIFMKKVMDTNLIRYGSLFKCNNGFVRKKYKSTNLQYQSSYEYDFLEFCEKNNVIHLIKKSPSFKYLNRESYHFPDYLYKNVIIEIKSKWILDIQGGEFLIQEKIKSVEYDGKYKYLLLLDKDYIQFEILIKQSQ